MGRILLLRLAVVGFAGSLFWFAPAMGQVETAWTATYSGPADENDRGWDVAVDHEGNVYVTGHSIGFGTGPDFTTIKYGPDGMQLWEPKIYNGPSNFYDIAVALDLDAEGNVYVTGYSCFNTDPYEYEYITMKYRPDGTLFWGPTAYHGPTAGGVHQPIGIGVDDNGNVYVTGNSEGGSETGRDWATVKYSSNGAEVWVKRYNGAGSMSDRVKAIAVDGAGYSYLTGAEESVDTLDDCVTVKYGPGGELCWVRKCSPARNNCGWDVAVDESGDVYVTGLSSEDWSLSIFVVKYSPSGEEVWTTTRSTEGGGASLSIAIDGQGDVCVSSRPHSGPIPATVKYDATDGSEIWSSSLDGRDMAVDDEGNVYVTNPATTAFCTSKLDALDGHAVWTMYYSGPEGRAAPFAIAVDGSGNVYVTGCAEGYETGFDIATVKYTPSKSLVIKDGNYGDVIPNADFELIRVGDPPSFPEETLGTFTTDEEGRYEFEMVGTDRYEFGTDTLDVGDTIKVALQVHTEPAVRHQDVLGTMYRIHLDNAKFDTLGVMTFDTLDGSSVVQEIIMDHTELRYSLLVSVEWDAEEVYHQGLQAGLRAFSNYMYDVTDGQARLDTVLIFDNWDFWREADMWIYANNIWWPKAGFRAIYNTARYPIRMPRKFFGEPDDCRRRTWDEHPLTEAVSSDYRTYCHEFGHYAFDFREEYEFDGNRCLFLYPRKYGLMDSQYDTEDLPSRPYTSEMSSGYHYMIDDCQNTDQYKQWGMSCWDWLELNMEGTYDVEGKDVFVPIQKPDERTLAVSLPSPPYVPGPNDTIYTPGVVLMDYDVGALVEFPEPIVPPAADMVTLACSVYNALGPCPKADVAVYNDYWFGAEPQRIYQGQTDDHGRIHTLGVKRTDYYIMCANRVRVRPPLGPLATAVEDVVWMCGEASSEGRKARVGNRFSIMQDGVGIELKPVEGDYPLICGIDLEGDTVSYRLQIGQPFLEDPTLELYPVEGDVYSYGFTLEGEEYTALISDSLGGSGIFTVWAVDDSSSPFFLNTDYVMMFCDSSVVLQHLIGPSGWSEVIFDTINTALERAVVLSSGYPPLREGLDTTAIQAGMVHCLAVSPSTLSGENRLTIHYADSDLETGIGIWGLETSLQIFRWDEGVSSWEGVGGEVDTLLNQVWTLISEPGVYAAFTTEVTGVEERGYGSSTPKTLRLLQNYPNPFVPNTRISFSLPRSNTVRLEVYNAAGQRVVTLVDGQLEAGQHTVEWQGRDSCGQPVPAGVYFYRIEADEETLTKKMVLVR